MRILFGFLLCFAVAAIVGLGTTWLTLTQGIAFGSLKIGAWTAWPKIGTIDADPYARATIARSGVLPVGSGDGIAFVARMDDQGHPLDGRCDVIIKGTTPAARFWTITLYDLQGRLIANLANRYSFTSQDIVRHDDGSFEIAIAPRARAGNWMPSGGAQAYMLILRLYDTPVGVTSRGGRDVPMPAITERVCS